MMHASLLNLAAFVALLSLAVSICTSSNCSLTTFVTTFLTIDAPNVTVYVPSKNTSVTSNGLSNVSTSIAAAASTIVGAGQAGTGPVSTASPVRNLTVMISTTTFSVSAALNTSTLLSTATLTASGPSNSKNKLSDTTTTITPAPTTSPSHASVIIPTGPSRTTTSTTTSVPFPRPSSPAHALRPPRILTILFNILSSIPHIHPAIDSFVSPTNALGNQAPLLTETNSTTSRVPQWASNIVTDLTPRATAITTTTTTIHPAVTGYKCPQGIIVPSGTHRPNTTNITSICNQNAAASLGNPVRRLFLLLLPRLFFYPIPPASASQRNGKHSYQPMPRQAQPTGTATAHGTGTGTVLDNQTPPLANLSTQVTSTVTRTHTFNTTMWITVENENTTTTRMPLGTCGGAAASVPPTAPTGHIAGNMTTDHYYYYPSASPSLNMTRAATPSMNTTTTTTTIPSSRMPPLGTGGGGNVTIMTATPSTTVVVSGTVSSACPALLLALAVAVLLV